MSDEEYKLIISKYQQKCFELFNSNVILETQIEKLNNTVVSLSDELEKLKKPKRTTKTEGDFE